MINLSFCVLVWNLVLCDFLLLCYLKINMMIKKYLRMLENFWIWFLEGFVVFLRLLFVYVICIFRMSFFCLNGVICYVLLVFLLYMEKFYVNFVLIKNFFVGWISFVCLFVYLKSYKVFYWFLMLSMGWLSKFKLLVR